jgi:hypothetical protein
MTRLIDSSRQMACPVTLKPLLITNFVRRSDTHEGQTFEEPHTYVMKHQSNATSKSQARKKQDSLSLLSNNLLEDCIST